MANTRSVSDHSNGEVFFNPTLPKRERSFFQAMKMLIKTKRSKWPEQVENKGISKLNEALGSNGIAVTFVNHATFLIQLSGLNILTDPVWSKRVSPFSWIGPSRVRKPGIAFEDLPKIDLILVSHNHYDHLDVNTLKKLNTKFSPKLFVSAGDRELVMSLGFKDVREFDWWESAEVGSGVGSGVKVTFAPTQHFSSRSPFDRNKSLWGSYMIQSHGRRIYFGGDAGYSTHYKTIHEKLGAPDIALLGIGAYEPNWFMKPVHMNPAEAVQAHLDLKSKLSIGMHFGTFQLSAEAIDQPPQDLKVALTKAGLSEESFVTMDEGETLLSLLD